MEDSDTKAGMPSSNEIISLLDERKGVVYVWTELRKRYGPPENNYGPFVRMVIHGHKASISTNVGMGVNHQSNGRGNAHGNAPSNGTVPNSGSTTAPEAGHSEDSITMRDVREADAIIDAHYPAIHYLPSPPAPKRDVYDEIDAAIGEYWRNMARVAPFIAILHELSKW